MKTYLVSMVWPGFLEPIAVGDNKRELLKFAKAKMIEKKGLGPVYRPGAMCSVPIEDRDFTIFEIPVVI
jgi:hypothetical protein